jgi:hypothetical protein
MDAACSKDGRDVKCIQNFSQKIQGRDHLGYLGLDGRKILKLILKK